MLAVLCARAQGESRLSGLSHLAAKESDRLQGTIRLLERLGRKTAVIGDVLTIFGNKDFFTASGLYDPDQDHRMAMAAQAANFYGASFKIETPQVTKKSFPHFWKNVGVEHV